MLTGNEHTKTENLPFARQDPEQIQKWALPAPSSVSIATTASVAVATTLGNSNSIN